MPISAALLILAVIAAVNLRLCTQYHPWYHHHQSTSTAIWQDRRPLTEEV